MIILEYILFDSLDDIQWLHCKNIGEAFGQWLHDLRQNPFMKLAEHFPQEACWAQVY